MPAGLDTNILIYAIDNKAGWKHNKAVEVIENVLKHPKDHVISSQIIAEALFYVVKRRYPAATPLIQALTYALTRKHA